MVALQLYHVLLDNETSVPPRIGVGYKTIPTVVDRR